MGYLDFYAEIPSDLGKYQFVFIDSVNKTELSNDELNAFYAKYPNTSFILVFQVTKDGNYRGGQDVEHDMDIVINVDENKRANQSGRFAQGIAIDIF